MFETTRRHTYGTGDTRSGEGSNAALGFEIEDRWEHDGQLMGLMLKAGEVRLGINQDDGKKGSDRKKGLGVSFYIEVENDIDKLAAAVKAAGVPLKMEPHDTEWGTRAFQVIEPTGFALTITSRSKS